MNHFRTTRSHGAGGLGFGGSSTGFSPDLTEHSGRVLLRPPLPANETEKRWTSLNSVGRSRTPGEGWGEGRAGASPGVAVPRQRPLTPTLSPPKTRAVMSLAVAGGKARVFRGSGGRKCRLPTDTAGFTLLEVLLTLAMAVVLMSLVGSAISFYANHLQTRDSDVRRVQLASATMRMIADDLKAALYPEEFDASTLEKFLASAASQGAAGTAQAAGLDEAGMETLGLSTADAASQETALETEPVDLSLNATSLARPGLIGNQYQIQFDISRLPRLEEYQPMLTPASEGLADVPSDIKTISYFVQAPGGAGVVDPLASVSDADANEFTIGGSAGSGLVRRQLDRQITSYAYETGGITSLQMSGDLLAPEVIAVEFQYWDGYQWQIQWNSDQMGALPLAVQVQLTFSDPDGIASGDPANVGSTSGRTFTQIVRLPMGRIVDQTELTAGGTTTGAGM